jgi:hypothetical protein
MSEEATFVVVLMDNQEIEVDLNTHGRKLYDSDYTVVADKALQKSTMRTPYSQRQQTEVKIYRLDIQRHPKLEIVRKYVATKRVYIPTERMTDAEYAAEEKDVLSDIPEDFHSFISHYAYEQGHSSGREDCIGYVRELVSGLKPAIEAYRKTLTGK